MQQPILGVGALNSKGGSRVVRELPFLKLFCISSHSKLQGSALAQLRDKFPQQATRLQSCSIMEQISKVQLTITASVIWLHLNFPSSFYRYTEKSTLLSQKKSHFNHASLYFSTLLGGQVLGRASWEKNALSFEPGTATTCFCWKSVSNNVPSVWDLTNHWCAGNNNDRLRISTFSFVCFVSRQTCIKDSFPRI